jgi:CDP-glucose 4,6-dehydratase
LEGLVVSFWKGKKVFVTGHTGFKGSWLTTWLLMNGARVRGFSDGVPTQPSMFEALELSKRCEHIEGDVRNLGRLRASVEEFNPEVIFHLAAQPLVRESYRQPVLTFETNVMGTANVLEVCRGLSSLESAIIITTDKVYQVGSKNSRAGFAETDRLGGFDPYSASKACAELVASSYRSSFLSGVPIFTVRAGNVIGGGDWSDDRLVPDAVRAFSKEQPLVIRNPGFVRPWQHVIDPLRGYLKIAENAANLQSESFAFNLGPPLKQCVPVLEVVNGFIKNWGAGARWEQASKELQAKETQILTLDSSLAEKAFGWKTQISLNPALQLTAEWYKTFYSAPEKLTGLTEKQISEWGTDR